jgi:hypothetical protein
VNGNLLTGEAKLNGIENQAISKFTDQKAVKYPVNLLFFSNRFR